MQPRRFLLMLAVLVAVFAPLIVGMYSPAVFYVLAFGLVFGLPAIGLCALLYRLGPAVKAERDARGKP